jgi:hypothetical protein
MEVIGGGEEEGRDWGERTFIDPYKVSIEEIIKSSCACVYT